MIHTARKRIAIVGTGIAGLTAAYLLRRQHDVTVFEAAGYVGGHTNTVAVDVESGRWDVDTGFIVHNPKAYPNFVSLLQQLGVASAPTEMSFSVKSLQSGLEYGASGMRRLFAQKRNALRPSFYRMLLDVLRFYREAPELLESGGDDSTTLGEYLDRKKFSRPFIEDHLIPYGAAIWSASADDMYAFPARFFAHFFHNHGFLSTEKPAWRVIENGSRTYVERLIEPFRNDIRLRTPVTSIRRDEAGVQIVTANDPYPERFDDVVLALHSDQALRLLSDPTPTEKDVLGKLGYQKNDVLLHTDEKVLPRRRRAWASWNYHVPAKKQDRVSVTYNMNLLQSLKAPETFCVTLNGVEAVDEGRVLKEIVYHHPRYTLDSISAQRRRHEICGVRHTHYCGAYWGYGFHEDGVVSALEVTRRFGEPTI
ncbi:MAG: FAD-dependent oxidoreductase [Gemmatimonadetes bacterium]|nr:FAD-dependent oxidoreductase [Gemmatimonadota bacterium]